MAIKCSDGMYDDANIQYFKTYKPENAFESDSIAALCSNFLKF